MKKIISLLSCLLIIIISCQVNDSLDSLESDFSLASKGKITPINSLQNELSHFGIQFNGMPFHENVQYENLDVEKLLENLPTVI